MKNNVYQEITEKIIAQLSKGIIPWEQPWFGTRGAISHSTGESYSLLNQMILGGESGEFITWHQIQMLKGRIIKGSKGRKVYFWGTIEVGDENEKGERIIKKIPYLRTFTVFRVDDCEGIENRWQSKQGNTATVPPITQAESTTNQYLNREGIKLEHKNSGEAYYSPRQDFINVPTINNFRSSEAYYSTLLHEIIHSTGHKKRLGRFNPDEHLSPFGSPDYSREELVAEIGASFLLKRLNIDNDKTLQQNSAYIQSWIRALNNDVRLIAVAAGRAEKAAQFVLGEKK
jgi:antirestriction protein ArdC